MANISLKITDAFYKRLVKKSKELGCHNLSDGIRFLLNFAMDAMEKGNSINENPKAFNKQFQYVAILYYMLNEYIGRQGQAGPEINKKAHQKAEKVIAELLT